MAWPRKPPIVVKGDAISLLRDQLNDRPPYHAIFHTLRVIGAVLAATLVIACAALGYLAYKPAIGLPDWFTSHLSYIDHTEPCWNRISRLCIDHEAKLSTYAVQISGPRQRVFLACDEYQKHRVPYTQYPYHDFPANDDAYCPSYTTPYAPLLQAERFPPTQSDAHRSTSWLTIARSNPQLSAAVTPSESGSKYIPTPLPPQPSETRRAPGRVPGVHLSARSLVDVLKHRPSPPHLKDLSHSDQTVDQRNWASSAVKQVLPSYYLGTTIEVFVSSFLSTTDLSALHDISVTAINMYGKGAVVALPPAAPTPYSLGLPPPSTPFPLAPSPFPSTLRCVSSAPLYIFHIFEDFGWHIFQYLIPLYTMLRQNHHLPPPTPFPNPAVLLRVADALDRVEQTNSDVLERGNTRNNNDLPRPHRPFLSIGVNGHPIVDIPRLTERLGMPRLNEWGIEDDNEAVLRHQSQPHIAYILDHTNNPATFATAGGSATEYFDFLQALLNTNSIPHALYGPPGTFKHGIQGKRDPGSSQPDENPVLNRYKVPGLPPTPPPLTQSLKDSLLTQRLRVRMLDDHKTSPYYTSLFKAHPLKRAWRLASQAHEVLKRKSPETANLESKKGEKSVGVVGLAVDSTDNDLMRKGGEFFPPEDRDPVVGPKEDAVGAKGGWKSCYRLAYIGYPLYEMMFKQLSEVAPDDVNAYVDYTLLRFPTDSILNHLERSLLRVKQHILSPPPPLPPLSLSFLPSQAPSSTSPSPTLPRSPLLQWYLTNAPLPPSVTYIGESILPYNAKHFGRSPVPGVRHFPFPSPRRPTALLVLRENWMPLAESAKMKKIKRRLLNWREVVTTLVNEGMNVIVVTWDALDMYAQMRVSDRADVYISVHGNNLSNFMWMNRKGGKPAWLIEIMPWGCAESVTGIDSNVGGYYGNLAEALGVRHALYINPNRKTSPLSREDFPPREHQAASPPWLTNPTKEYDASDIREPHLEYPEVDSHPHPWEPVDGEYRDRDAVVDIDWLKQTIKTASNDWARWRANQDRSGIYDA